MKRPKVFSRNISILNLLLVTIMILLANYIILPIFNLNFQYTLPVGNKITKDHSVNPSERQVQYPPLANYMLIAEENLFHPERKIIVGKVEKKEEPPLPKPEFILYGTLITDTVSLAYLEDLKAPHNTPGRGKRQYTLKKGDNLSGYTIKDIEMDKILIVRGEEKMTVSMYDSHKLKKRENISSASTTSTGEKASGKQPQQQTVRPPGLPPKSQPTAPGFNVKEKDRKIFDILNRINP
jgi:hypothetical protein